MKQRIILMLMAILCLTACQDEEVQKVAFDSELISVSAEAQTVNVEVTANCPWYIGIVSE